MTTAYGLSDECLNLPFACHSGNDHYFVYGHVRDYFVSENPALRIMMIRNPLAWLISRIQHEKRKSGNQIGLNLASAAVNFGGKYLNFLPDDLRTDALKWFNRRIKSSTSPISTGFDSSILLFDSILQRVELYFQTKVLVLDAAHYSESLLLLAHVFNTSSFLEPSPPPLPPSPIDPQGGRGLVDSSSSIPPASNAMSKKNNRQNAHKSLIASGNIGTTRLNEANPQQEGEVAGSYSEVKDITSIYELHDAIYNLALKEFFRQLRGVIVIQQ
jgi:hypothetical protein